MYVLICDKKNNLEMKVIWSCVWNNEGSKVYFEVVKVQVIDV